MSQEIEKHTKIHQNLKVLNSYIKKIRHNPTDESLENALKDHNFSQFEHASKSDRICTKRSDTSKRNRRANNKSRLYEDEKKIFEDIMKHKNNQSLDTKIDKNLPGHLKYTTLLSKDKKLRITNKNNSSQNTCKKKSKDVQANKYFSAPVSTKENGMTTKFKFQDKKNETQKSKVSNEEQKDDPRVAEKDSKPKEKASRARSSKSEHEVPKTHQKNKSKDSQTEHEVHPEADFHLPKNEDIQKIFSDTVNSPSDKIVHMSVINSMDNFEEEKKYLDSERSKNDPELDPSIIK